MYHVRQEALPHRGSSHNFVGAQHGDVGISVLLWTVNGEEFEAGAGDILVIKAGEENLG